MTESVPKPYNPQELLHPELYTPPKKTSLKKITIMVVIIAVCILFLLIIAMALEKMKYKKDLQSNIKKKVKIIQDNEALLSRARINFNITEFCQKNTDSPNCSSLNLPLDKITLIDNELSKVIEALIKYHNNPVKLLPSPSPTVVRDARCPITTYVDCMPGPENLYKPECEESFLTWAKQNCPGFEGAVY
jgi:hypothetical protein